MPRTVHLRAVEDAEAGVFVVTGEDYPGVVFEADTVEHALDRGTAIVADLMEANGENPEGVTVSVTEYRLVPHRELVAKVAA
jgi:predicted RNase H-like HicB family nuclease